MKNNYVLIFLTTFLLMFISTAYAAFSSVVTISGDGLVEKDNIAPTCGGWYLRDSNLSIQEAYNQNKFKNPATNATWTNENQKLFIECTDNMEGDYGCINVTEITDSNNQKRYYKEVKEYTTSVKTDSNVVTVTLKDAYQNERTCSLPVGGSNPYLDKTGPEITITPTAFNKFTYSAIDDVGVTGYMVTTTPVEPALDDVNWSLTPVEVLIDNTEAHTYYVWSKDEINITNKTISTYLLTKDEGEGTTLTLKHNNSTGVDLTTGYVLNGTNVYVEGSLNTSYNNLTISKNNVNISNPSTITINGNTTISSNADFDGIYVTFDSTGGSVDPTRKGVVTGNTYGELPTPTRSGYSFKGWSFVPSEYQEIEYIESTGTQYIDTNYFASINTKIEFETMCTDTRSVTKNTYTQITGARDTYHSSSAIQVAYNTYSDYIAIDYGTSGMASYQGNYISKNTKFNVSIANNDIRINNNIQTQAGLFSGTSPYSLWIFDDNNAGSSEKTYYGRLYSYKIYEAGIIKRNFIPCIEQSTGKAGLYDLVSNTFYGNSGTGDFVAGPSKGTVTNSTIVTEEQDHTLYAQWSFDNYNITYTMNGGYVEGTKCASENGTCTFSGTKQVCYGAYYNYNCKVATNSIACSNTEFTDPIPGWGKSCIVSTNPVSYDYNSGDLTIADPVKDEATFIGWSGTGLEGNTNKNITIPAGSTGNRSYTANWQNNRYTLTINPNGGSMTGKTSSYSITRVKDSKLAVPMPTRTGYTFAGWSKSGEGSLTKYGKGLYNDEGFASGNNSMGVYNNSGGGTVVHTRVSTNTYTNPMVNASYMIQIKTSGTASPGLGGFVQSTTSRANAVFYHVIVAQIPVGYNIEHAQNATGDGRTIEWLTPTAGTGRFETYIYKHTCGSSGTFSTFGHVYLVGTAATSSNPVTWYVAYANMFDYTASPNANNGQVFTFGEGNTTLTANWTINSYTLTYNNNGGSGCSNKTGTYGSTWGTLCTPTRSGYRFVRWNTNTSNTGTTYTASTTVSGNATVYAIWELAPVFAYLGQGTSFNVKSSYPNHYSKLTADNFIVVVQSMPALSAQGWTNPHQYLTASFTGFNVSKSYNASTGVLTISGNSYRVWGCYDDSYTACGDANAYGSVSPLVYLRYNYSNFYDLGTGTSFNIKSKYPSFYSSLSANNFIVGTTSIGNLYAQGWTNPHQYIYTNTNGFTVSKSYNASTGILTVSGNSYNVKSCGDDYAHECGDAQTTGSFSPRVYLYR